MVEPILSYSFYNLNLPAIYQYHNIFKLNKEIVNEYIEFGFDQYKNNEYRIYKLYKYLLSNNLLIDSSKIIEKINIFSPSIKLKHILKLCDKYKSDSNQFTTIQLESSIFQLFISNSIIPKSYFYQYISSSHSFQFEDNHNIIIGQLLNYIKLIYNFESNKENNNIIPNEYYFFYHYTETIQEINDKNGVNFKYISKFFKTNYQELNDKREKIQFITKFFEIITKNQLFRIIFSTLLLVSILEDANINIQDKLEILDYLFQLYHGNSKDILIYITRMDFLPKIMKNINYVEILDFLFRNKITQPYFFNQYNSFWLYVINLEILERYEKYMVELNNKFILFSIWRETNHSGRYYTNIFEKIKRALDKPEIYSQSKKILINFKNKILVNKYINQEEIFIQLYKTGKFCFDFKYLEFKRVPFKLFNWLLNNSNISNGLYVKQVYLNLPNNNILTFYDKLDAFKTMCHFQKYKNKLLRFSFDFLNNNDGISKSQYPILDYFFSNSNGEKDFIINYSRKNLIHSYISKLCLSGNFKFISINIFKSQLYIFSFE